jgi:plastocyanin
MRLARSLILIVLSTAAACSSGQGTATSGGGEHQAHEGPCRPQGKEVTLVVHNTAYDPVCLAAAAGKPLEVRFDNQDGGVRHNFAVYSAHPAEDPNAETLFTGRIVQGPAMVTYDVPALAAGTYHFHCDIHPNQMFGQFVVE